MSVIVDFIAGEDLTAARGLVLYSNSSEKVQKAGAAANATVVGICVQGAASDAVCKACVSGFATAIAGGTIEPHDYVTANASGKVVVASAQNDYIIGRYMPNLESGTQRDAAANDEIRILVFENPRVLVP
jgi:regulator of RNase E activity RraA